MSTLAAARADNFYYPADWDPSSENLKDHKLKKKYKDNPKKLAQIEQRKVKQAIRKEDPARLNRSIRIRFEVPFHIRCDGCDGMLAKGVRFNATKKQVGTFYSTKIFQFIMHCDYCLQRIVCQSDPEHCDYVFVEGAKRWLDSTKADNDIEYLRDEEEKHKIQNNPLYKLEVQKLDREKANESLPQIERLQEQQTQWKDDYDLNRLMRQRLKQEKALLAEQKAKQDPNLLLALPPPSLEDSLVAQQHFSNKDPTVLQQKKEVKRIKSQPILKSALGQRLSAIQQKVLQMPMATQRLLSRQLKRG